MTFRFGRHLTIALVLGLILRVALFLSFQPWSEEVERGKVLRADAGMYNQIAVNILEGRGFSFCTQAPYTPTMFRTPLYPLFLSAVYLVCGQRPWVALAVQILLSCLTIVLLSQTCRSIWNWRCGAVCAYLTALCPMLIITAQTLLTEALFMLLLSGFWLLWLLYALRDDLRFLAGSGVLLGVSVLCRPNPLYLPVGLVGLLLIHGTSRRSFKKSVIAGALFCLCYAAALLPWAAHNKVSMDSWSVTSLDKTILLKVCVAHIIQREHNLGSASEARCILNSIFLKKYDVSSISAEAGAPLSVFETTNSPLVELLAPADYKRADNQRIRLQNEGDVARAQRELALLLIRGRWRGYIALSLYGTARTMLVPPWQSLMWMIMPDVDNGALASACIQRDWGYLARAGWARSAFAVLMALFLAFVSVTVPLLAVIGFCITVRERRGMLFTLSWVLFTAYFLATNGPNWASRLRAPLLLVMIPLVAHALTNIYGELRNR